LKEADDAIYDRRKSAVEQERTIKEAELQTELSVQQKEQEIEESRILNERTIQRGKAETERERLQAEIAAETQRKELVTLNSENSRQQADAEAYTITERMKAFRELPVENLKAMALAKMEPEQLMAMAFESLAQNAGKIGELTITPDLFGQMLKKSVRG
jgi:nickel-dependent lactate racemase